jgi:hypothetical protein
MLTPAILPNPAIKPQPYDTLRSSHRAGEALDAAETEIVGDCEFAGASSGTIDEY